MCTLLQLRYLASQAKVYEPVRLDSFEPPLSRKYAWQQLELMEKGFSRHKAQRVVESWFADAIKCAFCSTLRKSFAALYKSCYDLQGKNTSFSFFWHAFACCGKRGKPRVRCCKAQHVAKAWFVGYTECVKFRLSPYGVLS